MFTVIYSFQTKPGKGEIFEKAWRDFTQLIYKYEGSLGSRLHKQKNGNYIAYAQWPNRLTWENSGKLLPKESNELKKTMKDSCISINTLFKMDVIDDLLKENTHSNSI